MKSIQDHFTSELDMSFPARFASPSLITQATQIIAADPTIPTDPFYFTDRLLNNQEASFSSLNRSTPQVMPASPPPNVAPPPPSVASYRPTSPANNEPPYDQITTLLCTLKKLIHIDFDLRDRRSAYNKKRQTKVFSQLRRKTRAICKIMRRKHAALSTAQLSQLAGSVCLLKMKHYAEQALSTLQELSRVITRLHRERQESAPRASPAAAENSTTQGETRVYTIDRERDTDEDPSAGNISRFVMPA